MDSATSDTGDSDVSVRSYSTVPTPSDWMDMMDEGPKPVQITDLPEEILEIILCTLSPYKDLKSGTLVCKQWHRVIRGLIAKLHKSFHDAVLESRVRWTAIPADGGPSITERYSHCACYFNKSLYVFGGCTSTNTTFNDLWRFNLASREWIRPLAMGTYPSPKACASLVVHRDRLVLYGGWSHPTPYPLHQAARFFSELHIYEPQTNRWSHVPYLSRSGPKPVAGHSASVVGEEMVVFGGSHLPGVGTDEVWVYSFMESSWRKQATTEPGPQPRFGQSQVTLDDKHILIVGGCGGPNRIYNDVWLLTLKDGHMWEWTEVQITRELTLPLLWCHPACKVGNAIVLLSKACRPSQNSSPDQTHPQDDALNPRQHNAHGDPLPPRPPPPRQPGGMSGGLQQASPRELSRGQGQGNPSPFRPPPFQRSSMGARSPKGQLLASQLSPGASGSSRSGLGGTPTQSSGASTAGAASRSEDHVANVSRDSSSPQWSTLSPQDSRESLKAGCTSEGGRPVLGISGAAEAYATGSRLSSQAVGGAQNRDFSQNSSGDQRPDPQFQRLGAEANGVNDAVFQPPRPVQRGSPSRLGSAIPTFHLRPLGGPLHETRCPMHLHVLDISQVISEGKASWKPLKENPCWESPEETVFYSLSEGRGELIMFGGIQKDISMQRGIGNHQNQVSKNLYIISSLDGPLDN